MTLTNSSIENIVVGGGIIGLSIAYELAKRGRTVKVLERERFGRNASWAGAGILPPTNAQTAIHPQEHLEALSHLLHEQWSAELQDLTGIDNGFMKCGGMYLARTTGELAALTGMELDWRYRKIDFESVDASDWERRFGSIGDSITMALQLDGSKIRKAVWVPGESQFNNAVHVKALVAACTKLGVVLRQDTGNVSIECSNNRIDGVSFGSERLEAEHYYLTAGPWSEQLVAPSKVPLPMQPVRGQVALYKLSLDGEFRPPWPVVNEGTRFLVPRRDGHVLAGATIEEAGFDCRTSEDEIRELRTWAEELSGALNPSTYVKSWAGLRPGTYDGFPYLGRLGELANAFVATGHFKAGLYLSTGTAVVMADLAEGNSSAIDLRPFSPSRASIYQSTDNQ